MSSVFKKIIVPTVLLAGAFAATNVMAAADGQIRITGQVLNKTCDIDINGAPTSTLLNLDPVGIADLNENVQLDAGASLKASRDMRTVNITLSNCALPGGATKAAVSFDSTGYGNTKTRTYRNSKLDDVNTMSTAAKGVEMGFSRAADTNNALLMDSSSLVGADYLDTTTGAQTYSFATRYVQTAADVKDVLAGEVETVATFSVVYQ